MNYVDAPRLAWPKHRAWCADAAVHLLRTRERRYPALVGAGKLTPADAANGLELMRCIVAQWRWAVDPAAPLAPAWDDQTDLFGAYNHLLAAEMAEAARRARQLADRQPANEQASQLADLCDALAWLQTCPYSRSGEARIVIAVRCERAVPGPSIDQALAA